MKALLSRPAWRVFLIVFAAGLAWSLATGQEWEDFYITYRASKNLAEGNGLTFTAGGQRVHSFTSPLGVLLPAASYLLTGRSSDRAALWIFRAMSFAALGGAAVFLWQLLRRLCAPVAPAAVLVALVVLDSKTICFAGSGMETGFVLLFFAWFLWAAGTRPPRLALHVGLAWGGMMWSRPDCCVYIAAFAAGLLLFAPGEGKFFATRLAWLRTILAAGGICALIYLPWFTWAWSYYGTPVPHTITAKGLFNDTSLAALVKSVLHFPAAIVTGGSTLKSTFMPYYGGSPDWPAFVSALAFTLALIPFVLFLLPFVRWEARLASFGYAVGHLYLTAVVGFPVPWYIPHVTLLGLVALALVFGQLLVAGPGLRRTAWTVMIVAILGTSGMTVVMARQAQLEMRIIERGVRTPIGLWLRDAARSRYETVFLEPLGFIGYYSQLKMLDYPGLCSPEVVAARRLTANHSYPFCWTDLVGILKPHWLVLRPAEEAEMVRHDERVLREHYDLVKTFDATAEIQRANFVPIRGYLEFNGIFRIYHRKNAPPARARPYAPLELPITVESLTAKESPLPVERAAVTALKAHAPSRLVAPVPAHATLLLGGFGLFEGAYANPGAATDGVEFVIEHVTPEGKRTELLRRFLNPVGVAADRGLQHFDLDLPADFVGEIVFTADPGPNHSNAFDWSYWDDLNFGLPPK